MRSLLSTWRRMVMVPSLGPILFVAVVSAWAGTRLAGAVLGGHEGFVDEVRRGSVLFAAVLALSLAEPLRMAADARGGLAMLRVARGGGHGLLARWLGLAAGTLPAQLAAAAGSGGVPAGLAELELAVLVMAAGGVALGTVLGQGRLVPALWLLLVAGHLRSWLGTASPWLAWPLPDLAGLHGVAGAGHGLVWSAAVLVAAALRLDALSRSGRGPARLGQV